jgi:hypothetical protein
MLPVHRNHAAVQECLSTSLPPNARLRSEYLYDDGIGLSTDTFMIYLFFFMSRFLSCSERLPYPQADVRKLVG